MRQYGKKVLAAVGMMWMCAGAKELFLFDTPRGLGQMHLQKRYCQRNVRGLEVCRTVTLSYPDCSACADRRVAGTIDGVLRDVLMRYRRSDPRQDVRERAAENEEYGLSHEERTSLELYAVTPSVVTLRIDTGGYSGGAHGYFATEFVNLDRRDGRRLKRSDLFVPGSGAAVKRAAERYYRLEHGIAFGASLRETDGWFEERFVLADTFAVTPRGLRFLYNQYEIKPYAAGQSSFLLPYGAIASLIDPKGPLGFALGNLGSIRAAFADRESQVGLDVKLLPDGKAALEIRARNLGIDRRGWLCVSFPGIKEVSRVEIVQSRGIKVRRYGAGRRIYHLREKRNLPANYLLVEGEDRNWSGEGTDRMLLKISPPSALRDLIVDIRLFFRERDGKTFLSPSEDEGTLRDQQGFPAYRVVLPLLRKH